MNSIYIHPSDQNKQNDFIHLVLMCAMWCAVHAILDCTLSISILCILWIEQMTTKAAKKNKNERKKVLENVDKLTIAVLGVAQHQSILFTVYAVCTFMCLMSDRRTTNDCRLFIYVKQNLLHLWWEQLNSGIAEKRDNNAFAVCKNKKWYIIIWTNYVVDEIRCLVFNIQIL